MAIPVKMKLKLIEAAPLVVQVAIEHVDAPEIALGKLAECTVTGKVRRVFVGDCECDTHLSFRVSVGSKKPPPGDRYENLERLQSAKLIEAYLEETDEPMVWRAIDTLLIEEIGNEPLLLTWLRQAVLEANTESKPIEK